MFGAFAAQLNFDGNNFPSQLPATWGQSFKHINFISIARAGLVSTLPREWGIEGAFPNLKRLWLYSNSGPHRCRPALVMVVQTLVTCSMPPERQELKSLTHRLLS